MEVPFVVRAAALGTNSKILFQFAVATYQAYNFWGGRSLYGHLENNQPRWEDPRAFKVSFNRPYISLYDLTHWELPFVQWLERYGFEVEYCTSIDLHADSHLLDNYNLLLSVGHDEYWSKEMRDNAEAFVANGGNIAFFSGNDCWWQVRFEDDNRTMVCYKNAALDPLYGVDNSRVTVNWFAPPVNRPENRLTGVSFRKGAWYGDSIVVPVGYTVRSAQHWIFEGTELSDGDEFGAAPNINDNLVGYETDAAYFTESGGRESGGAWRSGGRFLVRSWITWSYSGACLRRSTF
jgi:hypothetical protein